MQPAMVGYFFALKIIGTQGGFDNVSLKKDCERLWWGWLLSNWQGFIDTVQYPDASFWTPAHNLLADIVSLGDSVKLTLRPLKTECNKNNALCDL